MSKPIMNRSSAVAATVDVPRGSRSSIGDHARAVSAWRWLVILIFGLSSVLNYLDRQLLAAVAPTLRQEFGLSNAEYGMLLSAFSITYMLMSPLAGLFVDRVGLTAGATI